MYYNKAMSILSLSPILRGSVHGKVHRCSPITDTVFNKIDIVKVVAGALSVCEAIGGDRHASKMQQ